MWPFKTEKRKKTTDVLRQGMEMGFQYARRNPELPLEKMLYDIDHLNEQFDVMSTPELKLLIRKLDNRDRRS